MNNISPVSSKPTIRVQNSDGNGGGLAQLFTQMGASPEQAQQALQRIPAQLKQRWESMISQGQQQQVVQELQQAMQGVGGADPAQAQQVPQAEQTGEPQGPEQNTELQQAQAQAAQAQQAHQQIEQHQPPESQGFFGKLKNWWQTNIPTGATKFMIALATIAAGIFALKKGKQYLPSLNNLRNRSSANSTNNNTQPSWWSRQSRAAQLGYVGLGLLTAPPLIAGTFGALTGATNAYASYAKLWFGGLSSGASYAADAAKTTAVETAHEVLH